MLGMEGEPLIASTANAAQEAEDSDDEFSVGGNDFDLSLAIAQLATGVTEYMPINAEKRVAYQVTAHNKQMVVAMKALTKYNPRLAEAGDEFDGMSIYDVMSKSSPYEKAMGVAPSPRVLYDMFINKLQRNASKAELVAQQQKKLNDVGMTKGRDMESSFNVFTAEFKRQVNIMKVAGCPPNSGETASKYVAAIAAGVSHFPGLRDAHKAVLASIREAGRNGKNLPTIPDLENIVLDQIDLHQATAKTGKDHDKVNGKAKSDKVKDNKSFKNGLDESSFYSHYDKVGYEGGSKGRGQGYGNGTSGSGKGQGKGQGKGEMGKGSNGKGYGNTNSKGKGGKAPHKGYASWTRTDHKEQNHGPHGQKGGGASKQVSSKKWRSGYKDLESENESRGWLSSSDSGSEKSYYKPSYIKANKGSTQYSNAVKKALHQAKIDVNKAGRNKGWSEDQAEAYFNKAMAKRVMQNLSEEAPKGNDKYRRRRDERVAADESDGESSASSQSGWEW